MTRSGRRNWRKAMLYLRQSSAYQVSHNLESQILQYAMLDRLHQLGWHEVEVIDENLGRSAAGTQTRRHARVSNGWWQRSVLGASARLPLARFRDSRATVASGSNWSKFAVSLIPY